MLGQYSHLFVQNTSKSRDIFSLHNNIYDIHKQTYTLIDSRANVVGSIEGCTLALATLQHIANQTQLHNTKQTCVYLDMLFCWLIGF